MIQINLTNTKIKENLHNKIIYQPKYYSDKSKYKITFQTQYICQIQFVIYANFIDWIEIDCIGNITKYDYISTHGVLISTLINPTQYLTIRYKPIDLCTRLTIKNINVSVLNELTNIQIDKIFIINLPRRLDRKEQMIKKLSDANIDNYEFVEGLDGQTPQIINKFEKSKTDYYLKHSKPYPIITTGHYGCLLSHINAIKIAKSRNYSNIMILEDDVFFCENFLSQLSQLQIPQYDMIYLGGITSKKKLFLSDWAHCSNYKIMGAYGYILSKSMYDIILEKLTKLEDYVDLLYIRQIQPNYKVILLNDYIKTDLSSSDTSKKSKQMVKRLEYIK